MQKFVKFIPFLALLFVFNFPLVSSAASSSFPLPFYVESNFSTYFSSTFSNVFDVNHIDEYLDYDCYALSEPFSSWGQGYCYLYAFNSSSPVILRNSDLNADKPYTSFSYISDYVIIPTAYRFDLYLNNDTGKWTLQSISATPISNLALLGRVPYNFSNYSWTPNIPFHMKDVVFYDSSDNVVFVNNPDSALVVNPGDFQGHGDFLANWHNSNFNGSDIIQPNHVPPTYTINNYSWSTYTRPSVDLTSVENAINSLINITEYNFSYLFSNLHGELTNLTSNIKGFFTFIGETVAYWSELVIDNIKEGFDTLFNNFKDLVQPVFDGLSKVGTFFAWLVECGLDSDGNFSVVILVETLFVPDPDELSDVLVSHDTFGLIGVSEEITSFVITFKSHLQNDSALYTITLSQFVLAGKTLGPYVIDFSWYLNYKNIGDPIISAFLVFGFFMWLHYRLPYWLRGQQGDITNLTKEVNK